MGYENGACMCVTWFLLRGRYLISPRISKRAHRQHLYVRQRGTKNFRGEKTVREGVCSSWCARAVLCSERISFSLAYCVSLMYM